jgi:hypothetical protein
MAYTSWAFDGFMGMSQTVSWTEQAKKRDFHR